MKTRLEEKGAFHEAGPGHQSQYRWLVEQAIGMGLHQQVTIVLEDGDVERTVTNRLTEWIKRLGAEETIEWGRNDRGDLVLRKKLQEPIRESDSGNSSK